MRISLILIVLIVFIFLPSNAVSAEGLKDYQTWLSVESQNSHLKIKAYCRNNTSEGVILRHQLKVQKSGESGRTNSFQSGSVYLQSQSEKCLSQLGLRVSLKDEYEIKLEVYKDGKLVTEDFVVYSRGTWI